MYLSVYKCIQDKISTWFRQDKKSRILETKNLLTHADTKTDTILEKLHDLSAKKNVFEVG